MKNFTVTIQVQTDNYIDAQEIRNQICDACDEVPFSFDITEIKEDK